MENRILLTRSVFEWLIEHLVFIEESSDELVHFYYPDLPSEQEKMKLFFLAYVKKIEAQLERAEVVNAAEKYRYAQELNRFPFVIIGSRVELVNLTDSSRISLKIIHPVENSGNKRDNEVTYLSDLGKKLLLGEVGKEVFIDTPTGAQVFRVESIRLL